MNNVLDMKTVSSADGTRIAWMAKGAEIPPSSWSTAP